jgi:hypothetical protein
LSGLGVTRRRLDHKFASTDADGKFEMTGVPPGDYKVFAWETSSVEVTSIPPAHGVSATDFPR